MDKYLSKCLGGAVGVYFCAHFLASVVGVYDFVDSIVEILEILEVVGI